ncbi:MAG: hypothetical protein LUF87_08380 [Alistipes sp.]|nr:hypothetical protein [Alistipes sp.]
MYRRTIIAVAAALVITCAGILIFGKFYLDGFIKDIERTRTLQGNARDIVRGPAVSHETYGTDPGLWDPAGFQKAVYVEYFPYYDGEDDLSYRYSGRVNKLLGSEQYITEPQLDGIIAARSSYVTVGQYEDGRAAMRTDYDIFFLKLPEQVIVRHIFIEGQNPPPTRRSRDSGVGKAPTARQLAEAVREALSEQ